MDIENTKKNKATYTIKFNPIDPRHQEAMRVLDGAGRRKAQLIAEAICLYVHHGATIVSDFQRYRSQPGLGSARAIITPAPEAIATDIPTLNATLVPSPRPETPKPLNTDPSIDDELLQVAIGAIDTFLT